MRYSKSLIDYVSDGDLSTRLSNVKYSTNIREVITVECLQFYYDKGEIQ